MGNPFIVAEDLALKSFLQGMTVGDEKVASRPVKVWFGYPDVEIRAQEFPFATIDLIDIIPANDRQNSGYWSDGDYQGTIAPVNNVSYRYEMPIAYDLVYQVATYARNPRHDRALLYQMANKFPSKYGKLDVPNELGTEIGYRSMFLDGFVKRDAVDGETGNRRTLRNVYTIRVVSEMSPATAAKALTAVTSVTINSPQNNTYIPSVYEIL
jgi:hypothetical protein